MRKTTFLIICILICNIWSKSNAQNTSNPEINIGVIAQKTQYLYWENGIGADFTSNFLLDKRIHLKLNYLTSLLGSSMFSNAIHQHNIQLGADWRFRHNEAFQLLAGLNTGYFIANYENPIYDVLPSKSMLLSAEFGAVYKLNFPATINLSIGYNLITGDGFTKPGTLFPLFYKFGIYYRLK